MNELLAARHFTLPLACLLLLCTAGLENGFGADPPDGRSTAPSTSVPSAKRLVESDSLQVDYGSQLPRSTPLSPAEALKHFHVEPGYRLELVAAEPAVTDPIALAFDESGRMFVVEMRGYSEQRDERLGRIRCLEDRDADGTFETSWTVIEGLSWPTAIAVHRGGLLIGMPPDILWFSTLPPGPQGESPSGKPLTVADGELVFRGFGHQNVQGMLNSFRWGLDLRVYGSSGTNGGRVQMIRFPQSPQIDLQRRDFAIEMPTMRMQPVTGGNMA